MRSTRWLFGALALAAAFGLGAVLTPAAEDKAAAAGGGKGEKVIQDIKDIATAHDLIEYGQRKGDPRAICSGVMILVNTEDPAGGDKGKVEGGEEAKPEDLEAKKARLLKILEGAKKADTAANEPDKTLIKDTMDKVNGMTRGTPDGGTTQKIIVQVTNKGSDSPVASVTRLFLGGQKAVVSWTDIENKNVPVDVQVLDPSGNVVQHDAGKSGRMEWIVKKDTKYKIQFRDYHTVPTTVKLCTN